VRRAFAAGGLLAALVLGFGAGSIATGAGIDQYGKWINRVVVHPIPEAFAPIAGQWDDSQPHVLPGTTVTLVVPAAQHDFFLINNDGIGGINCNGQTQVVGAFPLLKNAAGTTIPFFTGRNQPVTPVLSGGTYTLGLSAFCQPPDAVNDPSATYQTNGDFVVTRVVSS
jgi:hypothetical protein